MEKKGFFKRKRDEYLALDRLDRKRYVTDGILNNALYILMVIFIIYTAIRNKNFLSPSSIANMLMLAAVSLPMALGIGGCIVLTGTDLSAGRVFGLAAGMSAAFLQNRAATKLIFEHLPSTTGGWIIAVMLMVMVAGAVIGLVNGFFVAKFSLHPFIVTLATQLITYGIILMFFQINGNGGGPTNQLKKGNQKFASKHVCSVTCSLICLFSSFRLGFPDGSAGKVSSWNAGDTGNVNSIPGSVRSPGEGTGNHSSTFA